jgi:hypothetical protein
MYDDTTEDIISNDLLEFIADDVDIRWKDVSILDDIFVADVDIIDDVMDELVTVEDIVDVGEAKDNTEISDENEVILNESTDRNKTNATV